jgi:5-methylcytosine-specific restriction endonuclease McrA
MQHTTTPSHCPAPPVNPPVRLWPCPECKRRLPAQEYFGSNDYRGSSRCKDCLAQDVERLDAEVARKEWIANRPGFESSARRGRISERTRARMKDAERHRVAANRRFDRRQDPALGRAQPHRHRAPHSPTHFTDKWVRILLRWQNWSCFYCGRLLQGRRWNVDHYLTISRGGDNRPSNIVLTCVTCNRRKGTMLAKDFMAKLRREREQVAKR